MSKTRYLGKVKNLTLIFLFPLFVQAQVNIIPNGSFEEIDSCPDGNMCGGQVELATPWFEPINCTSDLFHECSNGICSIPAFGDIYPYHGVSMSAIGLFGAAGGERREYISVELTNFLTQDSMYELSVRLHFSGGDGISVGSIGAFFSQDSMVDYSLNHYLYELPAQLQRNPDSIMSDSNIWYEWKDTLVAMGGEKFMMLGNFLSDANTPHYQPSWNTGSFYFIDMVELMPISKPNSTGELSMDFALSPNPTADVLRIDYNGNLNPTAVRLLTVEGRQVLAAPWSSELNLSGLADGLYLLQVAFGNGAVGTERVVVQR